MKKVLLPDVVWFQEGPGVRNTQYTDSGVKLLNVANLVDGKIDLSNTNRFISNDEAYGRYKHFLVDDGDLIIASSGIKVEYFDKKMGFINQSHLPLCMNTSTIRFKTLDSTKLDIRYFMYFLKSDNFKLQLSKQITGSAQLNFGPSHLKKMSIPIIAIEKQRRIASVLDKVSGLIDKRRRQMDRLDELVKSEFIEMFGDIETNPKCYEKIPFRELCDAIGDGLHGTPKYDDNGDFFFINGNNLKAKAIVITPETRRINKDEYERLFIKMGENTVLLSINGTLGNTGFYNDEPVALGKSACYCNLGKRLIREFVQGLFSSDSFQRFMETSATGTTIRNFGLKALREYKMIVPSLSEQHEYARFVQQADKSKDEIKKSLEKLETLKKALMQKYFE